MFWCLVGGISRQHGRILGCRSHRPTGQVSHKMLKTFFCPIWKMTSSRLTRWPRGVTTRSLECQAAYEFEFGGITLGGVESSLRGSRFQDRPFCYRHIL
jgi:hypothetical protein